MEFHVAAVQVATVWTNPESAREIDNLGTNNPTDIDGWLSSLSYQEKLAFCDENRIQTQLLYGESVLVTEVKGGWAKVLIPSQPSKKNKEGYPGWIPLKQLKKVSREEWFQAVFAAVKEKHAWIENEAGEKFVEISYMTCLPVLNHEGDRVLVKTPEGSGYLHREAVELFQVELGAEKGNGTQIIEAGKQFLDLDYIWGGMSSFGYDCSGFAYAMHKANGYQIPRDATDQADYGVEIPEDQLLPGDLLFFAYQEGKGKLHHVGLYYGDGKMLHSPQTGKGIEITVIKGTKYERELCIARRYWERS
nr:C40 family peptidase [Ornithinibacillus scapharcae]